jgi:hypothetical protein
VNSVFSSTSTQQQQPLPFHPPAAAEASTPNVSSILLLEASNKVKVLNLQRFDRFFLT